jgi:uncharacterized protein (DUF885 family)
LQDFFHYLKTDRRFMPFKTPQEVLDAYRSIYGKIKPHLAALFEQFPKTPFEIRRFETFREASQAGPAYVLGSVDGTRPGVFYVPVPDATKVNVTFYGMESNFLHEGIPGHHFQISLQQENKALPAFRRQPNFVGFLEGWALYAESLGKQLGCYTDPYQEMGALNSEVHRAIRLVADVAIHTGKMTREQAIAYMMAHEPVSEAIATAEIERYMAMPAQALSYKLGELKILALRKKYQQQLGAAFSLRRFHTALLQQGDMPLNILERYLDEWAAEEETTFSAKAGSLHNSILSQAAAWFCSELPACPCSTSSPHFLPAYSNRGRLPEMRHSTCGLVQIRNWQSQVRKKGCRAWLASAPSLAGAWGSSSFFCSGSANNQNQMFCSS